MVLGCEVTLPATNRADLGPEESEYMGLASQLCCRLSMREGSLHPLKTPKVKCHN